MSFVINIPFASFDEIKAIIGSLNSANDFDDIKPSIEHSVKQVKELIGADIYNLAIAHYNSANYQIETDDEGSSSSGSATISYSLLDELVYWLQRPLVYYAYERYSAYADLETSNAGRKMLVSDNKKNPFQWMIDKYDSALIRDANESMESLLEFLNDNRDSFPEWTGSEQYQTANGLLINSVKTFQLYYPIDNSFRFFLHLAPIIKRMEAKHIKSRLGEELYEELKADVLADSVSYEDLLDFCRDALVDLVISDAMMKFSMKIYPESVIQKFDTQSQTQKAQINDKDLQKSMSHMYKNEANEKLLAIENYVKILNINVSAEEEETVLDTTKKYFRV